MTRAEYYFVPLYKWDGTNIEPNINNYSELDHNAQNFNGKWNLTEPTIFAICNNKLYGWGKTYDLQANQSLKYGNLFNDENCRIFFGSNSMAGEAWHIYSDGWATFNILGSGLPVVTSYLGQFKQLST